MDQVIDRFRTLSESLAGEPIDPPADDGIPLSYRIAGTMQLPNGTKQRLLEERSEHARLDIIDSIIELALTTTEDS